MQSKVYPASHVSLWRTLKMALRLRIIFPYALPGVLALIGWWWFFSRKKEKSSNQEKRITDSALEVEALDELKELVSTEEVINDSTTLSSQLDLEESSVVPSCTSCSLSSAELMVYLSEEKSDGICKTRQRESIIPSNIVCPSQPFADAMFSTPFNTDKHDDLEPCGSDNTKELEALVDQTELITTGEVLHYSVIQSVQLDQESSILQSCSSCSLSADLVVSSFDANSDCIFEESIENESKGTNNIQFSEETTIPLSGVLKMQSDAYGGRNEDVENKVSDSKTLLYSLHENIKVKNDPEGVSELKTDVLLTLNKSSDNTIELEHDAGEVFENCMLNKELALYVQDTCSKNPETSLIGNDCLAAAHQKRDEHVRTAPETKVIESDKAGVLEGSDIHELSSSEKCHSETLQKSMVSHEPQPKSCVESVQTSYKEVETLSKVPVLVQHASTKEDERENIKDPSWILENHTEHCLTECLEVVLRKKETDSMLKCSTTPGFKEEHLDHGSMESVAKDLLSSSCIESGCTGILVQDIDANLLNAFSQDFGNYEHLPTSETATKKVSGEISGALLGEYEVKMVEQLAFNIISQVIVAAKQEILSGTLSDRSDTSCQIIHDKLCDSDVETCTSTQSNPFALEQVSSASNEQTEHFYEKDLSCECTHQEFKYMENIKSKRGKANTSLMEEEMQIPKTSEGTIHKDPNLSPVQAGDSFDEAHMVIEDSSLSVCTSEDGICMDDHLHSTRLSSFTISSYDTLSTSGIELSSEQISMSKVKVKNAKEVVNKGVVYSNGDIKGGSPDVKNEASWTAENEADHSGGSDVNSMDSVDSGCALVNIDQLSNNKQKVEGKSSDLVIWEFMVPSHLVGRLIGKQGRFVTYLKESSGAKIYISTLPYTQDVQICHIEGSQQQVDRLLSLIGKKFKDLNLTNIYAPPSPVALHSLPMTSWLMLPNGVTVEVIVVNVVNAGHMFVQQHTHPTFHALRSLDQQMHLCYSQPGIPSLPTPVEVGVICAAPVDDNTWWRAQVVAYFKESDEVDIRYVDYGGYERVKIDILRQIRSDFVTLPFQGAEVLLDNVIPLAGEDHFSSEADAAVNELTKGTSLLAQVTNYDSATSLPLIQLWSMMADEVASINCTLVERGFAQWIDSY
ncbi:A-kinase anchor protein 1, mitochondrial isoform X2 [Bombina bombina]|uniref:A-kinase anchor protein 1, mitochondrial isoform X2 n=1 Tax=Bombina bombina TaxID=8345 RepID=UPI00235AC7B2|nr:A-kinase anchor protein 1, mitochondrial isoform X2 [Bombina bombina]